MTTKYAKSRADQQVFTFLRPLPVSCVHFPVTGTGKGTHELVLVSVNLGAVGASLQHLCCAIYEIAKELVGETWEEWFFSFGECSSVKTQNVLKHF